MQELSPLFLEGKLVSPLLSELPTSNLGLQLIWSEQTSLCGATGSYNGLCSTGNGQGAFSVSVHAFCGLSKVLAELFSEPCLTKTNLSVFGQ